jgi:hypothetical protein
MSSFRTFNQKLAEKISSAVSTMWCAYLFAAIALISLPAAIKSGDPLIIVAWVAQTFLQLVLLSIIMVGQQAQADAIAQKINETHTASLAEFEFAKDAQVTAKQELAELRTIASEIHRILRDVEKK